MNAYFQTVSEPSPIRGHITKMDSLLHYHLKTCIWLAYYFTWVAVLCGIVADVDPYYYIVENLIKIGPISNFLTNIFGQRQFFQFIALFTARTFINIFVLYESVRLCLFCVVFILVISQVFMAIATPMRIRVDNGLSRKDAAIYNGLVILMEIIAKQIRTTTSFCIIAVTVVIVSSTFLAVKLHVEQPFYVTGYHAGVAGTTFFLTQLQLRTVSRCNELSKGFISAGKSEKVLVAMGSNDRKLCIMQVKCLKELALQVGLGPINFSRLTVSSKSEVMVYIVEETINMLMAF